jgi:pseudouridine synthase, rluA family
MTQISVSLPDGAECPAKAYLMRTCGISSGLWKRIKHSGSFAVNGVPCIAARTMLRDGDRISYDLPVVSSVVPEQIPLTIVYEDDDLLILDKPAGQLVHPTTWETHGTVANAVLGLYEARCTALDFHPCHRLDRNTTGLLLIAKHPEVQYQIGRANSLRREYLALIEGVLSPAAGTIDAPIARALPSIILRHVAPDGKPARTHYETIQTDGTHSLLRLCLETGRTHQIRVHLAHLGHPLLGDDLYGGNCARIKRHALHSARLTLTHPRTQALLTITAPLPEDMADVIRQQ